MPDLRVPLDTEDDSALTTLTGGIARRRWVRGAIRAARVDPAIALAIIDQAPPESRGGRRLGAGRPRVEK